MCGVEINSVPVTPGCPVNVKDTFLMVKEDGTDFVKMTYEDLQLCLSGIQIPQVQHEILSGGLKAYFREESINKTWLSMNPEVFLMRDKRKKKHKSKGVNEYVTKGQGIVHPHDKDNSIGKWAGWKWFGGKQVGVIPGTNPSLATSQDLLRQTEFPFTKTVANETELIPFVNEMFWRDVNGVDYFPETTLSGYYANTSLRPGGNFKGGSQIQKRRKTQKFYLVFAVDNPFATKTNELCPKIFGPISLPFYTTIAMDQGGSIRILLTAQPIRRKAVSSLMVS
jgi:hypothetical protein